jgi:hypothetical protein
MKISILGTGNVGSTLGRRFAALGHAVAYGTRDPQGAASLLAGHPGSARLLAPGDLAAHGEVIVLAVPGSASVEAVRSLGRLDGQIVVDATNPLLPDLAGLSLGLTDSLGEQVQRAAPGARVVKAFNTIGVAVMQNPRYGDRRALLLACSDDAVAKRTVLGLGESLGFEALDYGPLAGARTTEPLAMLWIRLAYLHGLGPDFALSLLRR